MMNRALKLTFSFLLILFSTAIGQTQRLQGRVVDAQRNPVEEATVKLTNANITTNTDNQGHFFLEIHTTALRAADNISPLATINNGSLNFTTDKNSQKIVIEVFNNVGQKINKLSLDNLPAGSQQIEILPREYPTYMVLVKLQIDDTYSFYKLLNLNEPFQKFPSSNMSLAKNSAFVDLLEINKQGFNNKTIEIESYNTALGDIIIEKDGANDEGLPPLQGGQDAGTTRYWDCCKPHCGWHSNMRMCDINGNDLWDQAAGSGCDNGPAFQCMDYSPIEINSRVSYGWAAFNNPGTNCGDCFQLDFQGNLADKQMIVQVINIGDGGQNSFDLLIPGGGVGANNGCSRQWNNPPLGATYGGFALTCKDNPECIRRMCQEAFGDKPDLMRGCEWYIGWFKSTSNPKVKYAKVPCPQEIKNISNIGN